MLSNLTRILQLAARSGSNTATSLSLICRASNLKHAAWFVVNGGCVVAARTALRMLTVLPHAFNIYPTGPTAGWLDLLLFCQVFFLLRRVTRPSTTCFLFGFYPLFLPPPFVSTIVKRCVPAVFYFQVCQSRHWCCFDPNKCFHAVTI